MWKARNDHAYRGCFVSEGHPAHDHPSHLLSKEEIPRALAFLEAVHQAPSGQRLIRDYQVQSGHPLELLDAARAHARRPVVPE